jgi:5-methylcytosine-specific restriction endonuclease McrA
MEKMCRKNCGSPAVNKGYCRPCDAKRNAEYRARAGVTEKLRANQRQRRADNPELVRALENAYARTPKGRDIDRRKKSRKRADKFGNPYEKYTLDEVLEKYGIVCYICGSEIDMNASRRVGLGDWENGLHIDHVLALSRGGSDTLDNVRPSHARCNLNKGANDLSSTAESSAVNKR